MTRLLLIDNDEDYRKALSVRLRAEGFEVATAASGEEAVRLTARQVPDLILLDKRMPGKGGEIVYGELRATAALREVPIILMTGELPAARWEPLIHPAGGRAYLLGKPEDHKPLVARIRELLGPA